ncbi:hypothetical protein F5Y17DRAFT_327750 [Xylariaceae sp. FL0594]|nr:hypothetical protein F5Y17DRAFT_327750 [Xylariaceae sp. FL0594]
MPGACLPFLVWILGSLFPVGWVFSVPHSVITKYIKQKLYDSPVSITPFSSPTVMPVFRPFPRLHRRQAQWTQCYSGMTPTRSPTFPRCRLQCQWDRDIYVQGLCRMGWGFLEFVKVSLSATDVQTYAAGFQNRDIVCPRSDATVVHLQSLHPSPRSLHM